jgi:hypothetical protein
MSAGFPEKYQCSETNNAYPPSGSRSSNHASSSLFLTTAPAQTLTQEVTYGRWLSSLWSSERLMSSSFTWLDYSEGERSKMLDVIDLLRQKETRDELGLGVVRDAFADMLFPGTSTIQTRARYFLFVPWIYRGLERRKIGSAPSGRKGWTSTRTATRSSTGICPRTPWTWSSAKAACTVTRDMP